jgi:dephospho-CoA kinase
MTAERTNGKVNGKSIIGITGGIGCGKTTVANLFAARGASVIDTDQIAHQLTLSGGAAMAAIRSEFGTKYVDANGAMDRASMRALVFGDPAAKRRLEAILHPLIGQETARQSAAAHGIYVMLVVPLLIESGNWKQRVARVLVIDCPEALQIARVMTRSGLTEAQVRAIMATQVSRQTRLAAADDVVTNDGEMSILTAQVDRLHAFYAGLAQ